MDNHTIIYGNHMVSSYTVNHILRHHRIQVITCDLIWCNHIPFIMYIYRPCRYHQSINHMTSSYVNNHMWYSHYTCGIIIYYIRVLSIINGSNHHNIVFCQTYEIIIGYGWSYAYGRSYMVNHIWSIIYGRSYMGDHIWSSYVSSFELLSLSTPRGWN